MLPIPLPLRIDTRVVFGTQIPALNCIFDILSSHFPLPTMKSQVQKKLRRSPNRPSWAERVGFRLAVSGGDALTQATSRTRALTQ